MDLGLGCDPHQLWLRIDTGYAVVGVGLQEGEVVVCAPIIRYMTGWRLERVLGYATSKGWLVEELLDARTQDKAGTDSAGTERRSLGSP